MWEFVLCCWFCLFSFGTDTLFVGERGDVTIVWNKKNIPFGWNIVFVSLLAFRITWDKKSLDLTRHVIPFRTYNETRDFANGGGFATTTSWPWKQQDQKAKVLQKNVVRKKRVGIRAKNLQHILCECSIPDMLLYTCPFLARAAKRGGIFFFVGGEE